MKELPKAYEPAKYEDEIYEKWEKSGLFNPDVCVKKEVCNKDAKSYAISMPPPNVTGTLHIGHAVMLAIEDILIRYYRMKGYRTLWLPGTDHAAIATQTKVEKDLKKEGLDRYQLGRETFLERVNRYAKESHDTIVNQIKKMGSSCDWSREAYTLDEVRTCVVRAVFKMMYDDGLIYRGERIVNWCPRCHSTLADDEVEYKEEKGKLYWLKYGPFILATARPETKLGDTAVAVHPSDKRYQDKVGKRFMIPGVLGEFEIVVVADRAVDPKFGSGAIKVTPAHDFADYEIAQRHNIPMRQVINEEGRMTENTGKYARMTTKEARKTIVEDMKKMGLIDHIEDNYVHNVAVCYRCGTVIEPIPSKQWFIDVNKNISRYKKSLKELSIEAVKKGVFGRKKIKIIPERFEKNYFHWMNNLRDWCVSRQIWFGHRIPVWYCGGQAKAAQLKMGFHQDVVPQVFNGKTKTYRLRDHGFKVGDKVLFENSQTRALFGYGLITAIEETTVEKINYQDSAHYVTYKSLGELIKAFKLRNPEKTVKRKSRAYLYAYRFHPFAKEDAREGCGQIIVSERNPPKCPACGGSNIIQDEDTLDTWFSSGLWTFSTLANSPEQIQIKDGKLFIDSDDFRNFHPTSILETGYDILFFWVARMIIMTTYAVGDIPFKDVYLHGLIRDEKGRKMSKSLGNVIDPLDMIKKYGTDATRLSLVVGTTPGNDMSLSEEKVAGFRNFANKLWNISRYIITSPKPKTQNSKPQLKAKNLTLADEWILGKIENLIDAVSQDLDNYRFSQAGEKLREFTWGDFADWYLEISKFEKNEEKCEILVYILENLLKLWHPFMPFVTERIWEEMGREKMLIIEQWPQKSPFNPAEAGGDGGFKDFNLIIDVIKTIRNARAENKVEPSKKIKAVIYAGKQKELIESQAHLIKNLRTGISELEILESRQKVLRTSKGLLESQKESGAIYITVSDIEIYLLGARDEEKEKERIKKEIENLEKIIKITETKLGNIEFTEKAPEKVINMEKEKLAKAENELRKLRE